MPGILSAVSGQFTKYLVLGTLLPVAIFVTLGLVFGQPVTPTSVPLVHVLESLDKQWFAISITATIVVLSGLLYNLNTPIIRLYEGYPWRLSLIGKWRIRRLQKKLDDAKSLYDRLTVARNVLKQNAADNNLQDELRSRRSRISLLIHSGLPSRGEILPTRLGNAIKTFEEYPFVQYGMDAVTLWPRIVAIAPKDYLSGIDDAKTSFDFFLNASFLSAVTAIVLLVLGLAFKRPFASDLTFILWAVEIIGLAVASSLFYRSSIGRAAAWGNLVKGTFDLYRWTLLNQFGYAQKPTTREDERKTWTEISQQIIYQDPVDRPPMPYAVPVSTDTVVVKSTPPGIQLQTIYGMKNIFLSSNLHLTCQITNLDSKRADTILLNLKPKDGWDFVWGSASIRSDGAVAHAVIESNLCFNLGSLDPQQESVFECDVMPVRSGG